MKRPEMLKLAKERGIEGAFKMKNDELASALGLVEDTHPIEPEEKQEPKASPKFNKTLFKANSIDNIDGYQFSPYLLVDNDSVTTDRNGKELSVVDFLKKSAWYGHRFIEVTGPTVETGSKRNKKETSVFYTETELRDFATNYDIDVSGCKTIEELYVRVFGGAPIAEG